MNANLCMPLISACCSVESSEVPARIQLSLQSQQPPDVFDKLDHRCNNCSENHERLEDVTKFSEECAQMIK